MESDLSTSSVSDRTPALDAVKTELMTISTDPLHPMHLGYHRGDRSVMDHIDTLYKQAVPAAPPVPSFTNPPEPQTGDTPEEADVRARNEVILAPLKTAWGQDFDTRYAAARRQATVLFGDGLEELFNDLGSRLRMQYGPRGETLGLKFLADLADLDQPH
jgi:hypothetical protein